MKFADYLQRSIDSSNSYIVAGLDPTWDALPEFILQQAQSKTSSDEELIEFALSDYLELCLSAVHQQVAAIKPNIAFFEQFGIGGLRAFSKLTAKARTLQVPVIADIKRGDIGSTAQAYSNAYLGTTKLGERTFSAFNVDAVTINPFLGFDTIEPFLQDAERYGKGIFILVKTSNPGSAAIQNIIQTQLSPVRSISDSLAEWIGTQSSRLQGECGYSGLGAVVGATYPEEARRLRSLMPKSFLLIPGMGAQGGSATDAVQGFSKESIAAAHVPKLRGAATINISRGIFANLPKDIKNADDFSKEIKQRVVSFNQQIESAAKQVFTEIEHGIVS